MQNASRLLVAYMPYKFHHHRIQQNLAQPWLIGYRRHPFTDRAWAVLGCGHRRDRATAYLTMLGRILRISSLLTIALATVLAVWFVVSASRLGLRSHSACSCRLLIHAFRSASSSSSAHCSIGGRLHDSMLSMRCACGWSSHGDRSSCSISINHGVRISPSDPFVKDAARPAVLLVHGYMCNRASWRRWVLEGLPQRVERRDNQPRTCLCAR